MNMRKSMSMSVKGKQFMALRFIAQVSEHTFSGKTGKLWRKREADILYRIFVGNRTIHNFTFPKR